MGAEIMGLGEEIKRNERGMGLDAELARPVGTPLTTRFLEFFPRVDYRIKKKRPAKKKIRPAKSFRIHKSS